MDLLLNIWYHGDRNKALNYSHFLMLGLNMKDLNALYKEKGYEFMKKYMDNVEELNNDTEFVNVISPEKDNEMIINTLKNEAIKEGMEEGLREGLREGREEGIYEKAIETAKNMLNKGLNIKLVSECTGLSIEKLNCIK